MNIARVFRTALLPSFIILLLLNVQHNIISKKTNFRADKIPFSNDNTLYCSEAVVQGCSVKKVFLEILQNS